MSHVESTTSPCLSSISCAPSCAACSRRRSGRSSDSSLVQAIGDCVPPDTLAAPWAEERVRDVFAPERRDLLDFGCGGSHHRAHLESLGYRWRGVDYMGGVASGVAATVESQPDVVFYDGLTLPSRMRASTSSSRCCPFTASKTSDARSRRSPASPPRRPVHRTDRGAGGHAGLYDLYLHAAWLPDRDGGGRPPPVPGVAQARRSVVPDPAVVDRVRIDRGGQRRRPAESRWAGLRMHREAGTKAGLSIRDINLLRVLFSAHIVFEAEKL